MDLAPVQKTTPIGGVPFAARALVQAAGTPVATDLPPSETVQQGSAGYAANPDAKRAFRDDRSPVVEHDISIDPDTQQIVFQAINDRGEIVLQLPDQAALRQRAYAREAETAAEKSHPVGMVERFV